MNELTAYLEQFGVLSCNDNPRLPSLSTVGLSWSHVTAAIDAHELFYCKAFSRTLYLSRRAYRLLASIRKKRTLCADAALILDMLTDAPPMESADIRRALPLSPKAFDRSFNELLSNLDVTAIRNGRYLNETWSTFLYGTAAEWEKYVLPYVSADPREELRALLCQTMCDRDFARLIK